MVRRRRASFEVARSASVKVSVAGNQQVDYQPSSDDRIGISTFAGASLRSPRCSGLYLSPEARFCESVSVYSGPGSRIGIAAMDVEQIRRHFRPDQIRLLFVGESPPDSGKFFYSGNSQMAHYMKRVLGRELFRGAKDFFAEFKASGCYLDDLVLAPVNKSSDRFRRQACRQAIPDLADRIRDHDPRVVIALLQRIKREVGDAVDQSGVDADFYATHFPGNGQQGRFESDIRNLLPVLRTALQERAN